MSAPGRPAQDLIDEMIKSVLARKGLETRWCGELLGEKDTQIDGLLRQNRGQAATIQAQADTIAALEADIARLQARLGEPPRGEVP